MIVGEPRGTGRERMEMSVGCDHRKTSAYSRGQVSLNIPWRVDAAGRLMDWQWRLQGPSSFGGRDKILSCSAAAINHLERRGNIVLHRIIWSLYTGRWWVGCYIWYSELSEEATGRGRSPSKPLIPSTASVPSYKYNAAVFVRYDTIRYDSVYLTCSKKLTCSQLSPLHETKKKHTKNNPEAW